MATFAARILWYNNIGMKILLVEDNPLTAKGLQYLLERENYQVDVASSLAEAEANLATQHYHLALLDVGLPDGDGFALAENLRRHSGSNHAAASAIVSRQTNLPIIFLTAKDDEADIVRGFELGAEDYITKPFRNRELLLRIQKALRPHQAAETFAEVGGLKLTIATGNFTKDGVQLDLSAVERHLLICLFEHAGQVVLRERLLDVIYDTSGSIVNDNTLSVYLKRLRQKLGDDVPIETVKNLGYRLCAKNSPAEQQL